MNKNLFPEDRFLWISAAAVPLIVLTMGGLVGLPVCDWIGHQTASYLEFVLATPVVLWVAWPFFKRGWDLVVNRSPNMWTLISLGVSAAYLCSIFATFLPAFSLNNIAWAKVSAHTSRRQW